VNLDPVDERVVVVQGGAYAEHQIASGSAEAVPAGDAPSVDGLLLGRAHQARPSAATAEVPAATAADVDHPHFTVRLAPGAGTRLTLRLKRYANQPTFAFPWA
jgi:hypothetical protein